MIKKFIALSMALSLLLLSGITVSGKSSKPTNYPGQSKAADIIVEAIKDNDVEKIESMLDLLVAQSYLLGMSREEFLDYSNKLFDKYEVKDYE